MAIGHQLVAYGLRALRLTALGLRVLKLKALSVQRARLVWRGLVVLLVGTVGVIMFGCTPNALKEGIEKSVQRNLSELGKDSSGARNDGAQVVARYRLGQEFTITFAMTEWKQEGGVTKGLPKEGKARVKVNCWEMRKQAGDEVPANGAVLVVNLTVAGDAGNANQYNPKGLVNPWTFGETGATPAPTFWVVDAKGRIYPQSDWLSWRLNDSQGVRTLSAIYTTDPQPKTLNLAFDVPPDVTQPRLRIEIIALTGSKRAVEVDLRLHTGLILSTWGWLI